MRNTVDVHRQQYVPVHHIIFGLLQALSRLGLIDYIGHQTEQVILAVDRDNRLTVAIILILWVSALASSFVDNIPLTTMMVRIVVSLNQNEQLELPLQPLVWALALGACLGGMHSTLNDKIIVYLWRLTH